MDHLDIVNNAAVTSDLTWSRAGERWKETLAVIKEEDFRQTQKGFISSRTVRITGVGVSVLWPHSLRLQGLTRIVRANVCWVVCVSGFGFSTLQVLSQ